MGWEAKLGSELWQFAGALAVFAVIVVLWMFIVYLPGRTMERWEDRRPEKRDDSG